MADRPIDQDTLQQTKQEIRALAREIAEMSKMDLGPEEYFGKFLDGVLSALAAVGGAVWTTETGQLALLHQVNLRTTELAEGGDDQLRHARLLQRVIETGEAMVVPPYSGAGEAEKGGNPTRFLLILVPLRSESSVEGVVEIFQRPGASPEVQRGYLRFMNQMCDLSSGWIKTRKLKQISDRQNLWQKIERFSQTVHESLDLRETSFVLANESQRFIGCDRVCVVARKGNKFYLEAVSGQDEVDKRSNMVTLMQRLSRRVLAAGDECWYTGDTENLPPQIEEALEDYVDHSHSKTIAVIPLRKPRHEAATPEQQERADDNADAGEIIGALVVEQIEDTTNTQTLRSLTEMVTPHAIRALTNAHDHNSVFLMPVWRTIGKSRWLVNAKNFPKTLVVAVGLLILIVASLLIPMDFELQGPGELQPVARRDVFTPVEGVVMKVHVEHGDFVKAGDPLLTLRNTDLMVQMETIIGQRRTTLERLTAVGIDLSKAASLPPNERARLVSEKTQLRQQLASLDTQFKLLEAKSKQLVVTSPIDGQVISWDVKKQLMNRPVAPGQVLLSVADPDSPWELIVQMPEDNIGYVNTARKEIQPDLDVEYILATNPGKALSGKILSVHERAETHAAAGHSVKIAVEISEEDLDEPRPGASATAKIYCGRRSIAFVWLHDVVEFVQRRILF